MIRTSLQRLFAGLMLSVLLAAYAGQQIHIYTEDLLHFASFYDADGANGADDADETDDGTFVARHDVDNFCICPCLVEVLSAPEFRAVVLGVLESFVTSCKCGAARQVISLRAPPAV